MRTKASKIQEKRRAAYLGQLKACGFRSWVSANRRRGELIDKDIDGSRTGGLSENESKELTELQKLADLYVRWKTNDSMGLAIRRMKRLMGKLEAKLR
jgi:hypothetical protein